MKPLADKRVEWGRMLMKKLELWLLGLRMNDCWNRIQKNRAEMDRLLEQRVSYTSKRLVWLEGEIMRLESVARRLELCYHRSG